MHLKIKNRVGSVMQEIVRKEKHGRKLRRSFEKTEIYTEAFFVR
jgi:hypothetical protein